LRLRGRKVNKKEFYREPHELIRMATRYELKVRAVRGKKNKNIFIFGQAKRIVRTHIGYEEKQ